MGTFQYRNRKPNRFKGADRVYVRVSKTTREVEFHYSWESACKKGGKKKKFWTNQTRKLLGFILNEWKDLTPTELDKWKAPKWLKDYKKRTERNKVHVTIKDGVIYLRFEALPTTTVIRKNCLFFQLYDIDWYIYEQLINLASLLGIDRLDVYTDQLDLLRINRIYWNQTPIKLIVNIVNPEKLRFEPKEGHNE